MPTTPAILNPTNPVQTGAGQSVLVGTTGVQGFNLTTTVPAGTGAMIVQVPVAGGNGTVRMSNQNVRLTSHDNIPFVSLGAWMNGSGSTARAIMLFLLNAPPVGSITARFEADYANSGSNNSNLRMQPVFFDRALSVGSFVMQRNMSWGALVNEGFLLPEGAVALASTLMLGSDFTVDSGSLVVDYINFNTNRFAAYTDAPDVAGVVSFAFTRTGASGSGGLYAYTIGGEGVAPPPALKITNPGDSLAIDRPCTVIFEAAGGDDEAVLSWGKDPGGAQGTGNPLAIAIAPGDLVTVTDGGQIAECRIDSADSPTIITTAGGEDMATPILTGQTTAALRRVPIYLHNASGPVEGYAASNLRLLRAIGAADLGTAAGSLVAVSSLGAGHYYYQATAGEVAGANKGPVRLIPTVAGVSARDGVFVITDDPDLYGAPTDSTALQAIVGAPVQTNDARLNYLDAPVSAAGGDSVWSTAQRDAALAAATAAATAAESVNTRLPAQPAAVGSAMALSPAERTAIHNARPAVSGVSAAIKERMELAFSRGVANTTAINANEDWVRFDDPAGPVYRARWNKATQAVVSVEVLV